LSELPDAGDETADLPTVGQAGPGAPDEPPEPARATASALPAAIAEDSVDTTVVYGPVAETSAEPPFEICGLLETHAEREPARVEIRATIRVRSGHLLVLVDGVEVRRRDLARPDRESKRTREETLIEPIDLAPGPHVVVAKLVRTNGAETEDSLAVDLGPGELASPVLVVGRLVGKDVIWRTPGSS
jgi:hypothetical protein